MSCAPRPPRARHPGTMPCCAPEPEQYHRSGPREERTLSSNTANLPDLQEELVTRYKVKHVFGVISWGCAATAWLAGTLNSHPDIFCVHAGNLALHTLAGVRQLD